MEKIKSLPLYRRFGFRVLIFNAILLISAIAPLWIIRKGEYKDLSDRFSAQGSLFNYSVTQMDWLSSDKWEQEFNALPAVFPRQRYLLFDSQGNQVKDSGERVDPETRINYSLWLPHPYIPEDRIADSKYLIRSLYKIPGGSERDFQRTQKAIINVQTSEGLDRVIVHARGIESADGEWRLLVLTSSVVDLLLQTRAVKERFLLLSLSVLLLGVGLSLLLSRSVTGPFRKLYRFSRGILDRQEQREDYSGLPRQGEIGAICQAQLRLIREHHQQSEGFRRFSSDVVHELRTPLTAIRSALELCQESGDREEQEALYRRIQQRIKHMEGLMEEIHQLGKLESSTEREQSCSVIETARKIKQEFASFSLELSLEPGLESTCIPLSSEKLYRLIRNLVDNGISFSPEKGSVSLELFQQGDFLNILVQDQGPGIHETLLKRLPERFYTFRPENHGIHSGLGLSIVQAILTSCKGELSYENRVERGASFLCRIPNHRT